MSERYLSISDFTSSSSISTSLIAFPALSNPEPIASFADVIAEPATLPTPLATLPATFAAVPNTDVIALNTSDSKSKSVTAHVIVPVSYTHLTLPTSDLV